MLRTSSPRERVGGRLAALVVLIATVWQANAEVQAPATPIDALDIIEIDTCFFGPDLAVDASCINCDADGDHDVDLLDVMFHQREFSASVSLSIPISSDADDGTEVDGYTWYADGADNSDRNRMGAIGGKSYDLALRYHLPDVYRGETFAYARIVLPASDQGQVSAAANLRVVGLAEDSAVGFEVSRPSQRPKTSAEVGWTLTEDWPTGAGADSCMPLLRHTPDIAPIINEIVKRPDWGSGPDGQALAIVIENESRDLNVLEVQDYRESEFVVCPDHVFSPTLELYRTTRSTFVGTELLGCPTDRSVTINAISLLTLEAFIEFGLATGQLAQQSPPVTIAGGTPIEITLADLLPDSAYAYRIQYRRPNEPLFRTGPLHRFHTQRSPGRQFTFTVLADTHLQRILAFQMEADYALMETVTRHIADDQPDFHIDLGDTFSCELYQGRNILDYQEALQRHLDQRPFLGRICHSAPFFIALGNHEGEQGWLLDGTPDNLAIWATNARKLLYPLPAPDGFYVGNAEAEDFVGLRENYYAWEWGNALFIVLDPFWYTTSKPHNQGVALGSGDNWDWTLGRDQYDWLCETLASSNAGLKFVFAHHITGGVNTYGRGGVEAARHAQGGRGSFEWGGEDLDGQYAFDIQRPGWGLPIHDVLASNHVSVFFHGHDHVFVRQELDGVIYQACPKPTDVNYSEGHYVPGMYYLSGDKVNNSGYLRVLVAPDQATIEYVRAYLPGDGPDGEVAYSYAVPAAGKK